MCLCLLCMVKSVVSSPNPEDANSDTDSSEAQWNRGPWGPVHRESTKSWKEELLGPSKNRKYVGGVAKRRSAVVKKNELAASKSSNSSSADVDDADFVEVVHCAFSDDSLSTTDGDDSTTDDNESASSIIDESDGTLDGHTDTEDEEEEEEEE